LISKYSIKHSTNSNICS